MTTPTERLRALIALSEAASLIVRETAPARRKQATKRVLVPIERIEALHRALRHYPGEAQIEALGFHRVQVLETEHKRFFDCWHEERRLREKAERDVQDLRDLLNEIPVSKIPAALLKRIGNAVLAGAATTDRGNT